MYIVTYKMLYKLKNIQIVGFFLLNCKYTLFNIVFWAAWLAFFNMEILNQVKPYMLDL